MIGSNVDNISYFAKMLFFAICFGHLGPTTGIYKQYNASMFVTGLRVAMNPLLLVLSYTSFYRVLEYLKC
jgi:hypothetical protein